MDISQNDMRQVVTYLENQIRELDFGKITIELVKTSDKIDVVVEERHRIFLTGKKK